jgi:predicted MFS family arabinose efflux permease
LNVTRYEGNYSGRQTVLWAIAVATCGVLPPFLTGGLAVQIRTELGFGAAALGVAVSLFFTTQALASAPFGRIVERIGPRRGMQAAALGSAASLLCIALFTSSWNGLIGFLVLGGFANAVSQVAANLALARGVRIERQGLAFGMKQAAIPTATLLSGLAVPLVGTTVGWRWAFIGCALGACAIACTMPKTTEGQVQRHTNERGDDMRPMPLILLALGIGLGSAAAVPLGTFIVESGVAAGFRVEFAGILLAVGGAVGIVVRLALGWLADRRSTGHLGIVAAMLIAGTVGFVLLATGVSWLFALGTMLAFGAGWGWHGLFNFAVVKYNRNAPAAATGITQTGAAAGSAVGPFLFGVLLESTSYGTAWLSAGAAALVAVAAILAGRWMLIRHLGAASKSS